MESKNKTTYQILDGLPPYGPAAHNFPQSFFREGVVVSFTRNDQSVFVANFEPPYPEDSRSQYVEVYLHQRCEQALVNAEGYLYAVDLASQKLLFQLPGYVSFTEESEDTVVCEVFGSEGEYADRHVYAVPPNYVPFSKKEPNGFTI